MSRTNGRGAAHDAAVNTGTDQRTDRERADDERALLEETVNRLQTKRDKAEQHLADAEQALADAKADLKKGGY